MNTMIHVSNNPQNNASNTTQIHTPINKKINIKIYYNTQSVYKSDNVFSMAIQFLFESI